MAAYYNEFDTFAAQWLRNLIAAGHIAPGEVDTRDIREVKPDDLRGFKQHHFFAGIGGWSRALRLAGWPDDRPAWTGSPPCQPFSIAGKQEGVKDERHLAPVWLDLVRAERPPVVFGEQVQAAVKKDAWLDDLLDVLEAEDYATGSIILPACSIGSPNLRQRIFFIARRLANPSIGRGRAFDRQPIAGFRQQEQNRGCGVSGRVGDTLKQRLEGHAGNVDNRNKPGRNNKEASRSIASSGSNIRVANPKCEQWLGRGAREKISKPGTIERTQRLCDAIGMADPDGRKPGKARCLQSQRQHGCRSQDSSPGRCRDQGARFGAKQEPSPSAFNLDWRSVDWLFCRDGKWRPVEPGSFPLANGVSSRVGRLRAYGNAINPYVAAAVIQSQMVKKYRPSNGTTGGAFTSEFCARCAHEDASEEKFCDISTRAHVHEINDPEYPPEWTYDHNDRPICTAFKLKPDEPYRCPDTKDMFG